MASVRCSVSEHIKGEEVASLPSVREERHDVAVERRVRRGVSVEEIAREYEVAKYLLMIAEAVGDEKKAEMQRERIKMLEDELKDAVSDEDYEDFWE